MRNIIKAVFFLGVISIAALSSCGSKQKPSNVYMPDMAYSRAYDAYSLHDTSIITTDRAHMGGNMIFYNSMPVAGTIKRGELYPYTLTNDSVGYAMSASIKNPITDSLSKQDLAEAGRLYNINCGICHGEKGAANGPLATGGKIGGVANIATGEKAGLSDGTMFHVMTYGKGIMGSYASQLSRQQRWMIVKYIRTLQKGDAPAGKDSAAVKKTDSTSVSTAAK